MRLSTMSLALAALALVASSASAARWEAGGHLLVASPQGDFAQVVDDGFGLQAYGVGNFDPEGWLGVRLDLGFVNYGSTSYTTPLTTTIPVRVKVNTSNNIGMLGIGPQFSVPTGPIRPYAYGTIGLGLFFTNTSVTNLGDGSEIASDMPQSSATLAYSGGGGVRIPVGRTISIDLGAEYRTHSDAKYLTEGDLSQDIGGNIIVRERQSDANLALYRLGITYSFPR
jgi:opacity protein-like surface antigen